MSIKNLIWHLTSVCCTPTRLSYHNISEEWLLMKMMNLIKKNFKLCCNGMLRSWFFFSIKQRNITLLITKWWYFQGKKQLPRNSHNLMVVLKCSVTLLLSNKREFIGRDCQVEAVLHLKRPLKSIKIFESLIDNSRRLACVYISNRKTMWLCTVKFLGLLPSHGLFNKWPARPALA